MVSVTDVAGGLRSYQAKPLIPARLVALALACLEFLALAAAAPIAGGAYYIAYYGGRCRFPPVM